MTGPAHPRSAARADPRTSGGVGALYPDGHPLSGLDTRELGRRAEFHDVLPSTNDRALDLAAAGAEHGTLVVAAAQTAGRGRRGRSWTTSPGRALCATVVLRPGRPVGAPTLLVAAAGLAVAEGLEDVVAARGGRVPSAGIKWPNDVWLGSRKVAGILVEARGYRPEDPAFVVGFGVNVRQTPEEFPPELRGSATSLRAETGLDLLPEDVLRAILIRMEARFDEALGRSASSFAEARAEVHAAVRADIRSDFRGSLTGAYRDRSILLGRSVVLFDGDVPVRGVVADLSVTDGLLLRTADGAVRHVRAEHASEVRFDEDPGVGAGMGSRA